MLIADVMFWPTQTLNCLLDWLMKQWGENVSKNFHYLGGAIRRTWRALNQSVDLHFNGVDIEMVDIVIC